MLSMLMGLPAGEMSPADADAMRRTMALYGLGSVVKGENAAPTLQSMMMMEMTRNKEAKEQAERDRINSTISSIWDTPGTTGGQSGSAPRRNALGRDMGSATVPGYRGNTVQHGGVTYDMGRSDVSDYASAIASVESGGRYDAVGPEVKGHRAYGKYQVMDFNIGPWTKEVLGREMTPQEFLASPEAQDAVFYAKFGSYIEKYGNPQDAASVWFSGRPLSQAGNASDGFTTVPHYVQRFTTALGQQQPSGGVQVASNDPSAGLGMIGGVKPGGGVWQSFDGSGRAHAANPQYEDYSQLFREYRFDPPDDTWVPVGERDGKTVYAAPDYARDENGNYLSVSAAEAQQLAQQRGSIIPTRDEVRGMYERAQQIPMPTSADFGKPGGQGTSDEYTQAVTRAAQQMGIDPGTPIVHGKEFFGQAQQPQQGQRVAQAMPETQMQPGALRMPFTPTGGLMEPGLGQQPQQPQQQPRTRTDWARIARNIRNSNLPPEEKSRQFQQLRTMMQIERDQQPPKRATAQDANGRMRYVDTGELVFPDVQQDPKPTTLRQNVEWLMSPEGGGYSRKDAVAIAKGGVNVDVDNNLGDSLSPGWEAVDKKFAENYLEWQTQGIADARNQAAQIASVLGKIEAGEELSGPAYGLMPEFLKAIVNPEAADAQARIEGVVQRSLRETLGAQFTEKEGARLIARAYDPMQPPETNAARLRALFKQIESAANAKAAMVEHFEENGTMRGYEGPRIPSIGDFYSALEGVGRSPISAADVRSMAPEDVVGADLTQMDSAAQAAWAKRMDELGY